MNLVPTLDSITCIPAVWLLACQQNFVAVRFCSPFKRNLEMTSCVSDTWKCYTISYLCFAAFKRGYFHGCYSVFGTSDLKCSNKNMRTCATKVKNWQEKIYSLNWEHWKWVELWHKILIHFTSIPTLKN